MRLKSVGLSKDLTFPWEGVGVRFDFFEEKRL